MGTTQGGSEPLHERVAALLPGLRPTERVVARFLADHPDQVMSSSAIRLAEQTGTSDATVLRTVKALGYTGLPDLKQQLLLAMTVRRDPVAVLGQRIDRLTADDAAICDQVLVDTAALINQTRTTIDPNAWTKSVDLLAASSSVLCYGIGPAGCLAELFALSLGRIGVSARSCDLTGFRLADSLLPLSARDTVVIIAPLREFREVDIVVEHARSVGAGSILLTEALGMAFRSRVDAVLTAPQSTTSLSNEIIALTALVDALVLCLARRDNIRATDTYKLLNRLRAETAGHELDTDPPLRALDYESDRDRGGAT
ncbi:MAG TPA: MurR/RpiR family transcriptional regulator [Pseudonocardiaceae bacterium]|nr:MurR/RpiR family transcriptional regulator [Pseudonocardiaceae bacterium]